MQVFRVLGAIFIGICVLTLFSGFEGVGGFGTLFPIVFTLLPLGIVFLAVGTALARALGPSIGSLRDGLAAEATVRTVRPTTMRVNGQPVMRIDLDLDVPGRGRLPVSVRRTVPLDRQMAVRPGAVLPAMVDPRDVRRFAIDWERVGLAGAGSDPFAMLSGLVGAAGFDLSGLIEQLGRAGMHVDPGLAGGAGERVEGPSVIDVTPGAAVGSGVAVAAEVVPAAGAAVDPPTTEALLVTGLLGTAAFAPGLPDLGRWGAAGAASASGAVAGGDATAAVDVTGETLSALRALGEPGRGIIREAVDLGIAIGDGRLVRLRLDVIPDGRTGFPVEHVALVPAAARWKIVTGVTVPLFLDRADPSHLAVDWAG